MIAAFYKTLFGDTANLAVVAVALAVEIIMVFAGLAHVAIFLVPPLLLIGAAWLATR